VVGSSSHFCFLVPHFPQQDNELAQERGGLVDQQPRERCHQHRRVDVDTARGYPGAGAVRVGSAATAEDFLPVSQQLLAVDVFTDID